MKHVDLRIGQPFQKKLSGSIDFIGRIIRVYDTFELTDFVPGLDLTSKVSFKRTLVIQDLAERDGYIVPVIASADLPDGLVVSVPESLGMRIGGQLSNVSGRHRLARLPLVHHDQEGDEREVPVLDSTVPSIGAVESLLRSLDAELLGAKLGIETLQATDLSEPE